jgi:hypothetical protein
MESDHERLFLAEHRLPRITDVELELLRSALVEACARVTARGNHVRYLRSTFLPGRDRLLSYFLAGSVEVVRSVAEIAQAPMDVLELAVDLEN